MKIVNFLLHFSRLFVPLASPKVLSFGKAQINLAFLSFFRNSGFAELTWHSEKFKQVWLFPRFYVTLASY